MANKNDSGAGCLGLLVLVGFIWLLIWLVVNFGFGAAFGIIFVVLVVLVAIAAPFLHQRTERERQKMLIELPSKIETHSHALRRNIDSAVIRNDYGKVISDSTEKKIDEFLQSTDLGFDHALLRAEAIKIVRTQLSLIEVRERAIGFRPDDLPLDGIEFEHWCARQFRLFGWETEVTRSGGDQGIDLIIKYGNVKVGVQTKLYSSPVGNKAVQEAFAGKVFYGLDRATVLSNAGFTKSAKELAATSGIVLMSHYDIPASKRLLLGTP